MLGGADLIFVLFIKQWSLIPKMYVIILSPLTLVASYCFYKHVKDKSDKSRKLLWIGISICQLKLFMNTTFFMFDFNLYMAEEGLAVIEALRVIEACRSILVMNYFSNKIIVFELI